MSNPLPFSNIEIDDMLEDEMMDLDITDSEDLENALELLEQAEDNLVEPLVF